MTTLGMSFCENCGAAYCQKLATKPTIDWGWQICHCGGRVMTFAQLTNPVREEVPPTVGSVPKL